MRTYLYHHFLSLSEIYIPKNLCAEIWETKAHSSKIQLHLRFTLAIDSCSRPALRTPTPHGEEKTLVLVIHAHRWNLRHHPGSALGFPGAPAVSSHGFVLVKLRGPTRHYCDDLVRKISWQRNRSLESVGSNKQAVMHGSIWGNARSTKGGKKREWHGHESTGEWRGWVLELDDDRSLDWISYPLVKTMWHELHILVFVSITYDSTLTSIYLWVLCQTGLVCMYGSRHFNAASNLQLMMLTLPGKWPPGGKKCNRTNWEVACQSIMLCPSLETMHARAHPVAVYSSTSCIV